MKTLLKIITGYIIIAFILGFFKGLIFGKSEEDNTE
jgi:hypothetical protein